MQLQSKTQSCTDLIKQQNQSISSGSTICFFIMFIYYKHYITAHGKAVESAARKQKYCRFLKFFRVHNLFSKKVLTNQAVGYNINTVVSTQVPRVLIHQNQNSKAVEKDDRRTARHNIIFDNRQLY